MVYVRGGHIVSILDGFTNIRFLASGGADSILHALMTSSISNSLQLRNSLGVMYVQTNVPVISGSVCCGGQSWVETPLVTVITVKNDGSKLKILGDVDVSYSYGGKVRNGAQLTITGTIKGNIDSEDNSVVNAQNCDNVISDDSSTCNAVPQIGQVDIGYYTPRSQILTGTHTCGGDNSSPSPLSASASSASSTSSALDGSTVTSGEAMPNYFAAITVVVVVAAVSTAMLI